MKWQKELSQLISCGWEPLFEQGRFAVRSRSRAPAITLYPPQGIYGTWFVRLIKSPGSSTGVYMAGDDAFDLLQRLGQAIDRDTHP